MTLHKIPFLSSRPAILAGILLAVFLTFRPCLNNELLLWDDDVHVWNNAAVQKLDGPHLIQIFQQTVNQTYIPLTTLSFAIERHFAGNKPFLYHLDNVILHMAVAALVFILALSLGLPTAAAACATLFFAIHPLRVESVAWVSERKDVLYAFFYLLSLIMYVRYVRTARARPYILALLCGFLSILSKPMALSLPAVLLTIDWILEREFSSRTLLDKVPFLLFTVPIAWLTYRLNAQPAIHDLAQAALVWTWCFSFYIWKTVWPLNLAPLYNLPLPVQIANAPFAFSAALLEGVLAGIGFFFKNRWLVFSWLYYFTSIFFLLRFDRSMDSNPVADRFMYLPCLGLCLYLGKALLDWYQRTVPKEPLLASAGRGSLIALFLVLGYLTNQQCRIWKNDLTLWEQTIRITPNDPLGYNNLAYYYYNKGELDLALANYNMTIKLNPNYYIPYITRGTIHFQKGNDQLALEDFNRAVAFRPDLAAPLSNRGAVNVRLGRYEQALEDLNEAIKLDPNMSASYNNRGHVYLIRQQWNRALADFNHSISINPRSIVGYFNRAEVYQNTGKPDLALKDYLIILQLDPNNREAANKVADLHKRSMSQSPSPSQ
jgi:tetratricopeptide (TPR) repeat protein